jgi:hypothetical protein
LPLPPLPTNAIFTVGTLSGNEDGFHYCGSQRTPDRPTPDRAITRPFEG